MVERQNAISGFLPVFSVFLSSFCIVIYCFETLFKVSISWLGILHILAVKDNGSDVKPGSNLCYSEYTTVLKNRTGSRNSYVARGKKWRSRNSIGAILEWPLSRHSCYRLLEKWENSVRSAVLLAAVSEEKRWSQFLLVFQHWSFFGLRSTEYRGGLSPQKNTGSLLKQQ